MNSINKNGQFWLIAPATMLISFGLLAFEVTLTRIFSVMLSYHFVFAVISFSLLGMGLGGMLVRSWQRRWPGMGISTTTTFFALLITFSVFAIIKLPVYENPDFVDFRIWIYIALAVLPFFFAGLSLAAIFQNYSGKSSVLYGFDLTGATLGALVAVAFLNTFGGVRSAYLIALFPVTGGLLISFSEPLSSSMKKLIAAAVLLLFFVLPGDFASPVPIANEVNKDMYHMLKSPMERAEIVESKWSSFGRTDLVRDDNNPAEMVLFVDGAAGSVMYNLDSLLNNKNNLRGLVNHYGLFFPFFFLEDEEKDDALVIGAGGGRDVVAALLGGVREITAVEVNPDLVALVKKYEDFNGGIYTSKPNITVVVQEGRNYLRSVHKRYDLIILAVPITKSSRSREGFALTENFLFTVEAFEDYLDHLTPEGRIVIVAHNKTEIYRLIALALKALKKRNIPQPHAMQHIYTISCGMMPTLVLKNQPFDSLGVQQRHRISHRLHFDRGSFFFPFVEQRTLRPPEQLSLDFTWRMFDQILVDLAKGKISLERLISIAPFDISPVTDDSPFFYKSEPGLPHPFGLFFLVIIGIFVLISLPFTFRSTALHRSVFFLKPFQRDPRLKHFLAIFFLLGGGFMLIEIALFQKLTLYLGQPVSTLTVLLFYLLLGTGVGSFISSLVKKKILVVLTLTAILIFFMTIALSLLITTLFTGIGLAPKILSGLLLFPLGLVLGFPFPLSIRLMKKYGVQEHVGWMWGVNGVASVMGSALTMIIGILSGFFYALLLGALFYGIVAVLTYGMKQYSTKRAPALTPYEESFSA